MRWWQAPRNSGSPRKQPWNIYLLYFLVLGHHMLDTSMHVVRLLVGGLLRGSDVSSSKQGVAVDVLLAVNAVSLS